MRTAAVRTDHEPGGTASGKRVRTRRRTVSGNGCRPFAQGLSDDSWHAFTPSAKTYAKTCLTGWVGGLELANVALTRRDLQRSLPGAAKSLWYENVLENQGVRPSVL
jgi:hypothetical protein